MLGTTTCSGACNVMFATRRVLSSLVVLLLPLAGGECEGSAGFQPAFSPIEFTISSTGEISVGANREIVTPIGTFRVDIAAGMPLVAPDRATLLVIRYPAGTTTMESRYRIDVRDRIIACLDGRFAQWFADRVVLISIKDRASRIILVPETTSCPGGTTTTQAVPIDHRAEYIRQAESACAQWTTRLPKNVTTSDPRAIAAWNQQVYDLRYNMLVAWNAITVPDTVYQAVSDIQNRHWQAVRAWYVVMRAYLAMVNAGNTSASRAAFDKARASYRRANNGAVRRARGFGFSACASTWATW